MTDGPKMRALPNDRWRQFVLEYIARGLKDQVPAAQAAGYQDTKHTTLAPMASRMARDERVIAAIQEECLKDVRLNAGAILRGMYQVAANDQHRDQGNMLRHLGAIVGLSPELKAAPRDELSEAETKLKIALLATQLGIDPTALLGNASVPPTPQIEHDDGTGPEDN